MYQCINGFTKAKMITAIRKGNNGKRSQGVGLGCAYRGTENNKCAVGCFIPDELYSPLMEKNVYDELIPIFPEIKNIVPLEVYGMLAMQRCHDLDSDEGFGNGLDMRDILVDWIEKNVI